MLRLDVPEKPGLTKLCYSFLTVCKVHVTYTYVSRSNLFAVGAFGRADIPFGRADIPDDNRTL